MIYDEENHPECAMIRYADSFPYFRDHVYMITYAKILKFDNEKLIVYGLYDPVNYQTFEFEEGELIVFDTLEDAAAFKTRMHKCKALA